MTANTANTKQFATKAGLPTISVVIPVFNRAHCIVRAIHSCLQQAKANLLEVLVVDDGSSDNTFEQVQSIDDPRVRLIRHPSNRGAAAARNTGIQNASGEYIAFLDSDDLWEQDKLRLQSEALGRTGWDKFAVCHCQYWAVSAIGRFILPSHAKPEGLGMGDYLFLQQGHVQTGSLLVPAELARRVGFSEDLKKHQDYDFCLRLEQQGARFEMVRQPLLTWYHDQRADRISLRHGQEASEHFLNTRRAMLGEKAAEAFWVRHIFPQQLRSTPASATGSLLKRMFLGKLQLQWYGKWIWLSALRLFRRLIGSMSAA